MASCLEREINAFLWLSLIGVTSFLLGKLVKIFQLWCKARLIPGPPCPSFYGHACLFSTSNLPDVLDKMHKKYGGVVKLWLAPTQLLVSVEEMDLIKEVLLKAEDKLPLTGRAFRLAFGRSSLFISSFHKVEHQRKSLELKLGGALLERATSIPKQILVRAIENAQSARHDGAVDSETISLHLAYTILGATLFGDTFLDWPKATLFKDLLLTIAKDACFWASYSVTPFWKRGFWMYQDSCAQLKCLTLELITECRQNRKSGFLWEFDALDHMEHEPCGEIISLMFHGSLTMASLIANILKRLVTHADVQDKIHSEIVIDQKTGRRLDEQNFDMSPNLLAVVYESARLHPAGPLLQRCSLQHDLKLKDGTVIPAGAIIVVPVQLVQMNSSNWGSDAAEFNPCRFLASTDVRCLVDLNNTLTGHTSSVAKVGKEVEAFLSFGSGTRACVGQKLAILGISSLFAALIERYELRPQLGSESNLKPKTNNCGLQLDSSLQIVFSKRGN
ncbi:cytochrome P450 4A25-like [Salvia hispanica]|uniref:cytochrome P450 4A25-like n=1 Tax=Salvia hispanica TaxID=49212 RepID=UPI0020096313|nr:cytochrome P450 4A25-like [Salvia hispanica]